MSFHRATFRFSTPSLLARATGAAGLVALVALACNGRLAVLEPPLTEAAAGSGGSSSVGEVPSNTGGSGAIEAVADAGPLTPGADAAPTPDPGPCSCASSPSLMALGCGTGSSGAPQISDDGLTVAFDLCEESGPCRPYRWTSTGGMTPLLGRGQSGTISHLSPDGDVLVISPPDEFGAEAIVYRASDGSTVRTGLRPYYASLALSANGSLVGLTVSDSGTTQLARWTRSGGREVLGDLPYQPAQVLLAGTPAAERIVGVNYSAGAANELFQWTPEDGLQIGPQDLPAVANGSPLALSRNGAALAAYRVPEDGSVSIARWTTAGVTEVTTTAPTALVALGFSADGAVLAGSSYGSDIAVCQRSPLTCAQYSSAFRWTEAGGVQQLTPGFGSRADVISADGSLVVGQVYDGAAALYSWTEARGARSVRADLEALGVDFSGWELSEPRAIGGNSRVIVGYGRCGTGQTIYRLQVPGEPPLSN